MKKTKRLFAATAAVAMCISLAACGAKSSDYRTALTQSNSMEATADYEYVDAGGGYYESYDSVASEDYEYNSGATTTSNVKTNGNAKENEQLNDSARKLIKTYNLDVETYDFDELLANIDAKVASLSGYMQNIDAYNGTYANSARRYSNMTVRIPVKYLDEFVEFVGNAGNVTNKRLSVEDVTLTYVDVESRKAAYEVEQERLLSFLEKAETLEDIITLESRLSEVRYQLQNLESRLRVYDDLVDYATVYLNVSEVIEYTEPEVIPVTFGDRISAAFADAIENFVDGFQNFCVNFVGSLPGLLVFAVIVVAAILIIKAIVKRHNKKKMKKQLQYQAAPQNVAPAAPQNVAPVAPQNVAPTASEEQKKSE